MKALPSSLFAVMLLASPAFSGIIKFDVTLNGPSESPVNASPGVGIGTVTFDTVANTMALDITFSGLLGTVTASHIHCCTTVADAGTAAVATTSPTFAGFPSGVTSGSYTNTLDLTLATSWNAPFITGNGGTTAGAEAALLAGVLAGKAYWNIHTTVVPGGEIRGFLVQETPEPTTFALGLTILLLTTFDARRRFIKARY